MKTLLKGVLYLSIAFLSARPALAANSVNGGIEVGANIGAANVTGSDAAGATFGAKAGLAIGGFFEAPINNIVSIQPEVFYSQQPFTVTDGGGNPEQTEHVEGVKIPILVKITFNPQSSTHVYAVVGPSIAFITRAVETAANRPDNDLKPQLETTDGTFIVGLGVSAGHFGVEGRYDGGFRNLNKSLNGNDPGAPDRLSVKTRSFTVLARWAFR